MPVRWGINTLFKSLSPQQAYDPLTPLPQRILIAMGCTLLMWKLGAKAALKFLDIVKTQVKEKFTEIVWADWAILAQAHCFLGKFSDQPITLADATSAAFLRLKGIPHIATFDRRFRLLGFSTVP